MKAEFAREYTDLEEWHWRFLGRMQILERNQGITRNSNRTLRLV